MTSEEKVLDISWGTIFKIALASFCFYMIYLLKDILILVVFAVIISFLFNPAVKFLQKLRIPRALAVVFIYIAIFGILGLCIYLMAPLFFSEIQQFSKLFPQYFEKIAPPLRGLGIEAFESMESFIQAMGQMLQKASSDILNAVSIFFGSIGATLFILTIALFISLEDRGIEKMIGTFVPKKHEDYILLLLEKSQAKVSGWFGARILTCIFVGVAFFAALHLFNVKYALTLGFLAGIFNFIPILGPIIIGALAFLVVVLDSWLKALFVLAAFFLIQQVENNIFCPILNKKFVNLPAVLVLISLAIGGRLLGVLGAILAIPLAGIIYEFLKDFLRKKKEEGKEPTI